MKTPFVLIALGALLGATPLNAADPTGIATSAGAVPSELQSAWVVDFDATIAKAKTSPKWKAGDDAMLPMMQKHYSALEIEFLPAQVIMKMHGKAQPASDITNKGREGDAVVLEAAPPQGVKGKPMSIRVSFPAKDRMNMLISGSHDMDCVIWMKKPAGWKPASQSEVVGAVVGTVVASANAGHTKVTPSPAGPEKAGWEQSNGRQASYRINKTITQEEFAKFCSAHTDAESLDITEAQQLTSLTPLSNLKGLKSLKLRRMSDRRKEKQTYDLAPLASLTELVELDCYATYVKNLQALKPLTKLKKASFYMSEVPSLEGLPGSIEDLNLYGFGHKFPNYAPLAAMKLKSLDVYMNEQATSKNLAVLKGMTTLESFNTALTKTVSDIRFLADCPNLRKIDLWDNPVSDITPLANKPNLTEVGLAGTKIHDIRALSVCKKLESIDLSDTAVTDISFLAQNPNLRSVKLKGTKIKDLTPLAGKENLSHVDIFGTGITDISPLLDCKHLSMVNLPAEIPATQIEKLKAGNKYLSVNIEPKK